MDKWEKFLFWNVILIPLTLAVGFFLRWNISALMFAIFIVVLPMEFLSVYFGDKMGKWKLFLSIMLVMILIISIAGAFLGVPAYNVGALIGWIFWIQLIITLTKKNKNKKSSLKK